MIAINIRDGKPEDYTPSVLLLLENMERLIEFAKEDVMKECPYDLEHVLFHMKRTLRETTEIVNKVADYYEVAATIKPNKEDVILTKPLEPRNEHENSK